MLLLFVVPSSAGANLPRLPSKLIVPFQSLGGVSIGESYAAAKKTWGAASGNTSSCSEKGGGWCTYTTVTLGNASFQCYRQRVVQIAIGYDNSAKEKPEFSATPLNALKTASGIGLGSSFGKLAAAYPSGSVTSIFGASTWKYGLIGPHNLRTYFVLDGRSPSARITQIQVFEPNPG
ncbi:MAG TPA: hypothetical protein VFA97_10640 [Gaiellaceae bacterium]|nr:hypothetical protein [Gaiellaceae bacterium]